MPSSKPQDDGFVKLGSQVYLRRPSQVDETDVSSPNIILVFGWMGAQLRHVHKYTAVYEEMYPSATQILVMSTASFFWCPEGTKRKILSPVVEILEAMGAIPGMSSKVLDPKIAFTPRVLIHSFSNGGAYCLVTLGKMLTARPLPSGEFTPRTKCALILDSAPGGGGFAGAVNAFTVHIKGALMKFFGRIFVGTLYVLGYMIGPLFGRKSSLQRIREALYNAQLLPWMDKRTPRLYIYSKQDEMVPWADTETHAHAASAMGRNVTTLRFDDSPHVAHARTHPTEYWDAVKSLWQEAVTLDAES